MTAASSPPGHALVIPRHLGDTSDLRGGFRMIIPERAKC
jgi:hypothetical protein